MVEVELGAADLSRARMAGVDLRAARLRGVNLTDADLRRAKLNRADLREAVAVGTNLTGSQVYGIAAWNVDLRGAVQRDLLITPEGEHAITTDNLAIAQFLYLLLHNERIRDVIETVGRKAVLAPLTGHRRGPDRSQKRPPRVDGGRAGAALSPGTADRCAVRD